MVLWFSVLGSCVPGSTQRNASPKTLWAEPAQVRCGHACPGRMVSEFSMDSALLRYASSRSIESKFSSSSVKIFSRRRNAIGSKSPLHSIASSRIEPPRFRGNAMRFFAYLFKQHQSFEECFASLRCSSGLIAMEASRDFGVYAIKWQFCQ